MLRLITSKMIVVSACLMILFACHSSDDWNNSGQQRLQLREAMHDADTIGYARAIKPRQFIFPKDHGPHPDYKTEWWYFTGNLENSDGLQFGYQFTIFRSALTAQKTQRASDWATDQLYMAHFAVSNIKDNEFYYRERFSRGANKLAGAQINPLRVWLEDWSVRQLDQSASIPLPDLVIQAAEEDFAIDLHLRSLKQPVLQGDKGLSQKGSGTGNASYYYSLTRLQTSGQLMVKGEKYNVSGYSWMDREWSTSALDKWQTGWDWFALQLDNDTEIMYYQLRQTGNKIDPLSKGTLVFPDGNYQPIGIDDVQLTAIDTWSGPLGTNYPIQWRLQIPQQKIDLQITPFFPGQELDLVVRYWEGAVNINGYIADKLVKGKGYVELTGYADSAAF